MTKNKASTIWSDLDGLRGKQELTYENIFRKLNKKLSFSELNELSNGYGKKQDMYFVPTDELVNFIMDVFELGERETIFDYFLYPGTLSHQVAKKLKSKLEGLQMQESMYSIFDKYYTDYNTSIYLKKPKDKKFNKKIDLIISLLPFGIRDTHSSKDSHVKTSFLEDALILKSLKGLKENGKGIFLVSDNFFSRGSNIIEEISRQGFAINAIISLSAGTMPNTNISSNLILIEKSDQGKAFLVPYTENKKILRNIKTKLKNKIDDDVLSTGLFISLNNYTGLNHLKLAYKINKKLKRISFPNKKTIEELSTKINTVGKNNSFVENKNSIYIPKIGTSEVVSNLSQLKIKAENYYQIILNDLYCLNEYLAHFLNSDLGNQLLNSASSGFIHRINRTNLEQLEVPYLDLKQQKELIKMQKKIDHIKQELTKSEISLWDKFDSGEVNSTLSKLNKDPLDEWQKSLPNPLSILLQHYKTNKDIQKKKEYLLYFFEAYIELNFSILFSLLKNNSSYYNKYMRKIFSEKDLKYLEKAGFGTWLELSRKIAKFLRSRTGEDKNELSSNINDIDLNQINAFTSKKIFNIFEEVVNLRNTWAGHSGPLSDAKSQEIVLQLEQYINELLEESSLTFYYCKLIFAQNMTYKKGTYYNETKLLRGSNYPFEEVEIESTKPLEKNKIYLSVLDNEPIPVYPFIKMKSSSSKQKNLFYFYNRIDRKGVRYITYTMQDEPDIYEQEASIQEIINYHGV